MSERRKIVVMGGGTGTFVVLSGLKHYPVDLTAVVTMADTGGSARLERDRYGLLPNSDVRKALIGLSEINGRKGGLLRDLLSYRFDQGEMAGMTFGNLLLVVLSRVLGSQEEAIARAGEILRIKGRVLPVTMDKVDLVARYEDGSMVTGEHLIDDPEHDGKLKIVELAAEPKGRMFEPARAAIEAAEMIVLGPGDLYTSVLAPVVVDEVAALIASGRARLVYVVNLMTKYGQTYGFKVSDHVREVEKYLGRKLDRVIINSSPMPAESLNKYRDEQAVPVEDDLGADPNVVRADVLQPAEVEPENGDPLKRSWLRHDPQKLAKVVVNL